MSGKEELDEKTQKLVSESLSFEEVQKDLNNTSPLQMSKKLIEYELFDQQSSIDVMDKIYEEFEDGGDVVDGLVTPVFLNICDGLIKHPKLGLAKSGITATRLVGEIKHFDYDDTHSTKRDIIQDKANLDQNTKVHKDDKGKYARKDMDNNRKSSIAKERFGGNRTMSSELEVNDKGSKKRLYLHQNDESIQKRKAEGKKTTHLSQNADHDVPLKQVYDNFGTSTVLSKNDLKKISNIDKNFDIISEKLNKSKGGKTWTEYLEKNPNAVNEETKKKILSREKEAISNLEKEANKTVANNFLKESKHIKNITSEAGKQAVDDTKNQAMGEVVILLIKPIYYEFSDIFKNGMLADLDTNSKIEAFKLRMNRVKKYVINNLKGSFMDILKDFLKNFITMVINGIVNAFVGLLKKILQVISEGFMSIVEAFKIMMKPSEELSSGQKADAITKLLATTVITFLGAYFEETILGFMNDTPLEFLKDVTMIMLTGIASTVVVWLLDQADLFSAKDEKRLARVKEVFALRIENIKNNTDIFEKESLEVLAKQKLQFKKIMDNMNHAIDNNLNVNDSVYEMASFMQIDLKVKSTDDFMQMLIQNKRLNI
ncbi:MAG: DNA repair protein [Campylobacterota bacterium]|nr:DNA repair protein [Campylobacterota bacterium]